GSGVTAVECLANGRHFIGYDINPLALLIARVRATPIPQKKLMAALDVIVHSYRHAQPECVEFPNIRYWFEEHVIHDLSRLRRSILALPEEAVSNFFKVAFSETVRRVSNTRYNEFKLLRKSENNGASDVLKVFKEISLRNIGLLTSFYSSLLPREVTLKIEEHNSATGIPLEEESVDLILTSPPYGDSRTTVAYGQFSRLSLRWLGLEETVDRTSLGARPAEITSELPSALLYESLESIARQNERRAQEVFAFYQDLYRCVVPLAKRVKRGKYACFVVGNRRVKGIELPTDKIVADFVEHQGFQHQRTIVRAISNKRMPSQNAPSNIKGEKDLTMRYEYIVILKKC
ncbi:MAG: DNA methyltransferase, partial [Fimbriimonadales bacterium]